VLEKRSHSDEEEAKVIDDRLTAVFPITTSDAAPPSLAVLLAILLSSTVVDNERRVEEGSNTDLNL
jgi:hypothetical protein